MSTLTKLLAAGAATALAATALGAAVPATADNVGGSAGPQGPYVTARVTFTGDVSGGGGTRPVSVPATCWWTPIHSDILLGDPPIDANDPESVAQFFREAELGNQGSFSFARMGLPEPEEIQAAIAAAAAGEDITWYHGECVDGVDPIGSGFLRKGGTFQGFDIAVAYQAFPTGAEPPPIVAAETLAQEALKVLHIESPEVDRNPKIGLGGSQAALVTLPTYFWVTNVDGALGDAPVGHKQVVATAGAAQATLTADTTGISISAPAGALENGGRECDAATITRPYAAGVAEGDLCGVRFSRPSVGRGAGWPVSVTSHWNVAWTGVEANGDVNPGGPLALLNPTQSDIDVPVAESQAVVDGPGN